jgi:hypothetical protein
MLCFALTLQVLLSKLLQGGCVLSSCLLAVSEQVVKSSASQNCSYAVSDNEAKKGTSMKAFVMQAIGQASFMEKPIPHPDPNDATRSATVT